MMGKKFYLMTFAVAAFLALAFQAAGGDDPRPKKVRSSDDWLIAGMGFYMNDQFVEADTLLHRALKCNPSNDAAHFYIGNIAIAQNDADKALKHLEAAYRLDTGNVWYAMKLARVYTVLGRLKQADKMYDKLGKERPGDAALISEIVDLYMKQGRYEEADSALNRIEMLVGPSNFTDATRLELYRVQGRYSEFFESLNHYFMNPSLDAGAKVKMIRGLLDTGDPRFNYGHINDYFKLVGTCLETHPSDTAAVHFAASFYYSLERKDLAMKLCNSFPHDPEMAIMKSTIHILRNEHKAALECCNEILANGELDNKKKSDFLCIKGDCLSALGQMEESYAAYEESLKFNNKNESALNNYAYSMSCQGRKLSKCASMAKKAVAIRPNEAAFLDTYAWVLFQQKKYAQAEKFLRQALLCGGDKNSGVLQHFGEILQAQGKNDQAEVYFERAKLKKNAKE